MAGPLSIEDQRDAFTQAIIEASRKRVRDIMADVAAKAEDELRRRLAAVADEMAMNVLGYYDIQWDQRRLVITVKKEAA